jgi:hypothetical protein
MSSRCLGSKDEISRAVAFRALSNCNCFKDRPNPSPRPARPRRAMAAKENRNISVSPKYTPSAGGFAREASSRHHPFRANRQFILLFGQISARGVRFSATRVVRNAGAVLANCPERATRPGGVFQHHGNSHCRHYGQQTEPASHLQHGYKLFSRCF